VSASVLYMSMSLDGYIAGPHDEPGNPGGDEFMRLHEWYGFGPNGPDASDLESIQQSRLGQHFLDEGKRDADVLGGVRSCERLLGEPGGGERTRPCNNCPG
jgi:hypothetical protein